MDPYSDQAAAAKRELVRGQQLALQLKENLQRSLSEGEAVNVLMEGISASLSRALDALNSRNTRDFKSAQLASTSSNTTYGSSVPERREENVKKNPSAKPSDDGHLWKKYGEKLIAGSKYRRSYFKCRLRKEQGCQAMNRVQQTDSDPEMFLVTNIGEHTCTTSIDAFSSPGDQCFLKFGSDSWNEGAKKWPLTQETATSNQGPVSSPNCQIPNLTMRNAVPQDPEINVTLTSPDPSDMDLMVDNIFASDVGFFYYDENVSFMQPSSGNAYPEMIRNQR